MTRFTNEEQEIRVRNLQMRIADLEKENLALADEIKTLKKKYEGRFYCKWCGEMKPIDERREITDETEFVTWLGCVDCYENKKRLDHVTG